MESAETPPTESAVDIASEVAVAAEKARQGAEAKARRLRGQLGDPAEAELWRRRGRALQAAPPAAWSEELKRVELKEPPGPAESGTCSTASPDVDAPEEAQPPAPLTEASLLTVQLPRPGKSFQENADACFKQADKIERTNARCMPLILEADRDAERWQAVVASFKQCANTPELLEEAQSLYSELCSAGHIKKPACSARALNPDAGLRRKYGKGIDCFRSPSGYEVVVGRTAETNERVSFELTPPDSFWFHSDCGVPGSHVAIMCPASEVATLEDVEFAAAIAAWHSKAREQDIAAVCYCYGAQVTRPAFRKLGLVHIVGKRGRLLVAPALPETDDC